MKKLELLGATAIALLVANPAFAQTAPQTGDTTAEEGIGDIVVTAQRQSETLQSVPIAVSAFDAKALERQQINTTSDLQLTLPNITFSKGNFTSSSSFTIRGIGDLCVGVTCDAATAVHVNDVPILGSPIFQNEYFDMERIEVLRGPQGTLYGRNATAGVINFITAKPDLSGFHASAEGDYGNYNSYRVKGMVNLPLGDTFGIRLAGYYLKRDGFTKNLFTSHQIDGRDQFDVRGSVRWEPSSDTKLDIVAHYFREKDNRSRNQKQLCHRDPTGILGCAPDRLEFGQLNGDATLASILTSREFLTLNNVALAPFALGSLYGTDGDVYSGFTNPANRRTVSIDSEPTFFTQEKQVLLNFEQSLGQVGLKLSGGYTEGSTDSSVDYNLAVERSLAANSGLLTLNAAGAVPGSPFATVRSRLIPNGTSSVCQSLAEPTGTGVYGGHAICAPTSLDFDRSKASSRQYTGEAILETKFDGMFNFLLGGVYLDNKVRDNSYYVNSFALDYASGILGAAGTGGVAYLGTPFYRNNSDLFRLKSYGLFGEAYAKFSDRIKLTVGLRYNHDQKFVHARTSLFSDAKTRTLTTLPGGSVALLDAEGHSITVSNSTSVAVPFGATDFTQALNYAALDFDANTPGLQPFADASVSFGRLTGRAVLDFQITPQNLVYLSYSRGYKSGGINPPLSPIFTVPTTFTPETVDAFEIGTKNSFLGGSLRLNLTGFYYKYKDLQLSRIVARTSVNDNISANIYGVEAEAIIKPSRSLLVNLGASYLHSRVSADRFFGNPQDPSGGRSDAVIIKDITNGSNCAIRPATGRNGTAAGANGLVATINGALGIGLQAPTPVPGTSTTGAFSICGALAAAAAGNVGAFNPAFAALQPLLNLNFNGGAPGTLPYVVDPSGVLVNVRGNQLPQSPTYKFSAGAQYTAELSNGMTIVPRFDLTYTGEYFGSIFNRNINRIQGYAVMNAQIQINGRDDRWFVRGYIQNLNNNNAITGLYVTDQSSGLFTNAFTLEPRRYGIAAGVKF